MTPAELKRHRGAADQAQAELEHGERIAYWHLMDLLDQGSPELSRALDGELHRLEATGDLVIVEEAEGVGSVVEVRREEKAAPKKKKAAPKKKKAAPKKKKAPKKKR